jgi:hypothetical protein
MIEFQTIGTRAHGSDIHERFLLLQGGDLRIINSRFEKARGIRTNFEGEMSYLSAISSVFINFRNLDLSHAEHNIGNHVLTSR